MIFDNLAVDTDELPQVGELRFESLEKKYLNVSLLAEASFFILLLIGGICLIIFNDDIATVWTNFVYICGGIIFLWAFTIMITYKGFFKKMYALRSRDVIYKKGLIWQSRTSIPFTRVQHAEIKQGPIDRMYSLYSLKIYTAGGQSSDLVIPGLTEDKAQSLKEFILKRTAIDAPDLN